MLYDLPNSIVGFEYNQAAPIVAAQVQTEYLPLSYYLAPELTRRTNQIALYSATAAIEAMTGMDDNWDGFGARQINQQTRNNCLACLPWLLLLAPSPEITPNPSGTLSFEWESEKGAAHLEVGQSKLSFYVKIYDGKSYYIDGNTTDFQFHSMSVGSLVSSNLFTPNHNPSSFQKISVTANESYTR